VTTYQKNLQNRLVDSLSKKKGEGGKDQLLFFAWKKKGGPGSLVRVASWPKGVSCANKQIKKKELLSRSSLEKDGGGRHLPPWHSRESDASKSRERKRKLRNKKETQVTYESESAKKTRFQSSANAFNLSDVCGGKGRGKGKEP